MQLQQGRCTEYCRTIGHPIVCMELQPGSETQETGLRSQARWRHGPGGIHFKEARSASTVAAGHPFPFARMRLTNLASLFPITIQPVSIAEVS